MNALSEFFSMGGYAFYVWSSFGATFLLVGGIVAWSRHELATTRRQVFARARQMTPRQ